MLGYLSVPRVILKCSLLLTGVIETITLAGVASQKCVGEVL
jgi:hypothetical protein